MDYISSEDTDPGPSIETPNPQARGNLLLKLKEKIYTRRPVLSEIVQRHGSMTLFDYCRAVGTQATPPQHNRCQEFISVVRKITKERLGEAVAQDVETQLGQTYQVSTADHHGPLIHPFFINSNFIYSLPYFQSPAEHLKHLVVLSFSSVSLNNSSEPRGILFHSQQNGKLNLHRLSFFPDKMKMATVFAAPAYTLADSTRMKKELHRRATAGEIEPDQEQKLLELFEQVFEHKDVLHSQRYSEQITKMNWHLWHKFFQNSSQAHPGIVYIDIERVVSELLVRSHLFNTESPVHKIIFDPDWGRAAATAFDGILGAFSLKDQSGTHYFWAIDNKGHRVGLIRKGDVLRSSDNSLEIPLTPYSLATALQSHKIFPSMLLDFILVSFIYGVKCLGGFNQVNYLTSMKESWVRLMEQFKLPEEARHAQNVETKTLSDGLTIAYMKSGETLEQATGIDLIHSGRGDLSGRLIEIAKRVSLDDVFSSMLPEIYRVVYAAQDREEDMLTLTPSEISEMTGFKKRLTALIDMSTLPHPLPA